MTIINKTYKWNGSLAKRNSTKYIVLHHAAISKASADDIHKSHKNNGWSGIGYHYYVRKDGKIYQGRPIDMIGAQTSGYNNQSIGICFEGNFEIEAMSDAQLKSGQELITYLKEVYPKALIRKHKDLNTTACPGKNFPFDKISNPSVNYTILTKPNDIVWELHHRGIITDKELWQKKCHNKSNSYWLAYKICNMTKNALYRPALIGTVNDIVWELHHRGIITDKKLWIELFSEDTDLYWLGYKACNMTENK